MNLPKVDVIVGVVLDNKGQVLIAKRPNGKHLSGLWEFPGGKLEQGETLEQALARELMEEIGISVEECQFLTSVEHYYPEKIVFLSVYVVTDFLGIPESLEGQEIRWVSFENINDYPLPDANQAIIKALEPVMVQRDYFTV